MAVLGEHVHGYASLPKASPTQLPLLIPGARNCVVNLMNTQPGETFLIIAEQTVDPLVVQAFEAVATMVGAEVSTMRVKPFSPAGIDPDNPSDMVVQAYAGADNVVIMSWFPDIHSRKLPSNACEIYNNKPVSMYQLATAGCLASPASRFPLPLMYEIMRKMRRDVAEGQIRITNDLGTDLVVKAPSVDMLFGGIGRGIEQVDQLKRGVRAHFPPSTTGFVPVEADGIFVPDGNVVTGQSEHPIKFTVEGGYVTNIEGEWEAEAVRAFINGPGRDPAPKRLTECMWGLNPKARLSGVDATPIEKERHAGVLHLGVATYQREENQNTSWVSHVDNYLYNPTMWLNGEIMVRGRDLYLLHDEEIRSVAKEFGDPDELLTPGQPLDTITC